MVRRSPIEVYEEARESLASYLDTAYRIGHPLVARERGALVREDSITAQKPFVESTPPFRTTRPLSDVQAAPIPSVLARLFESHTLGRRPLYAHQERALTSAWDEEGAVKSLVIATGTGSGKTEAFLLPVLADILREMEGWPLGLENLPLTGSMQAGTWRHRRFGEERPPATRAIILYPMNALVNDQTARLRRILSTNQALAFLSEQFGHNRIYFGQYTSRARVPGHWSNSNRLRAWRDYFGQIQADWASLNEREREDGDWIRPDGPELYCRWDMQAAPPDILVTNYSMLEYMLLRPIERSIWEATRKWLNESERNVLTVVLDEAHMYTGARGSEVAHLLRRLYDRLGVRPRQLRCIATSATLGEGEGAEAPIRAFVSRLFGVASERFEVIRAEADPELSLEKATYEVDEQFASALAGFQRELNDHPVGRRRPFGSDRRKCW